MANRKAKRPKVAVANPALEPAIGEKRPTQSAEHGIADNGPLAWRFSGADQTGPFSWHCLTDEFQSVVERLREYETKSWSDIKKTGSHPIGVVNLEKQAREQLVAVKHDDIDELMSFRISGSQRVWAIQQASCKNIMRILWWDPDHSVYKTEKDKNDRQKRKRKQGRK